MKLKYIPFLLIFSRILIGIIIGFLALFTVKNHESWIVSLMILGLITDIFDGIIARKLNVSSEKLRTWDSTVDLFFWSIVVFSIFSLNSTFFLENWVWISSVVLLELFSYFISFIKFKKMIATHSILAKIWTLSLLWFLIDLTLRSTSQLPFAVCIALGILSRIEINLIILKLKKWTVDVPSILSVAKINRGIPVRKFKVFNS